MPRRAFVADLQEAIASFHRPNVSDIKPGEDDGQVVLRYNGRGVSTDIVALVPDLGEYPESHEYMFFTSADSVHPEIQQAIDSLPGCSRRKVADMLTKVVGYLDKVTVDKDGEPTSLGDDGTMDIDSDSDDEIQDEADDEDEQPDEYDSDDEAFSNKTAKINFSNSTYESNQSTGSLQILRRRIRHDLDLAKKARFRVSYIGKLHKGSLNGLITLSVRVSKLDISEEALSAWNMEANQYFMIILRYSAGYQTLDDLISGEGSGVDIRVGLAEGYKISTEDAVAAFTKMEDTSNPSNHVAGKSQTGPKGLARLFIQGPLEELLNHRLISLLKYRMAMGFPWLGAEEFYNDHQGRNLEQSTPDTRYWREEDLKSGFTSNDHLTSIERQKSFPTLAMQFALRHLTRCTEFCLVCHRQVGTSFEALKPYVCSNPLCLYQYMSLGFGPSMEHEIVWQPWVVDLLISFCYNSAHSRRLKDLPNGMALMVPPSIATWEYQMILSDIHKTGSSNAQVVPGLSSNPVSGQATGAATHSEPGTYSAKYDKVHLELAFDGNAQRAPLSVGSWITVWSDPNTPSMHFQIKEMVYPIARLSKPLVASQFAPEPARSETTSKSFYGSSAAPNSAPIGGVPTPPLIEVEGLKSSLEPVTFAVWNLNFDDLDEQGKYASICFLLDTLPTVSEMRAFLQGCGGQDVSLRHFHRPIPPAALGLLRWIIASNRSCIVQVDQHGTGAKWSEERVSGMPGWLQFRFAQGAPDKEQRFMTSIQTTTATAKHPTIFAWHGSPLYNWHGIVREGLHFKEADHGRAFGHGVYHAMDCNTSLGYTRLGRGSYHVTSQARDGSWRPGQWINSQLRISSAIALNEIINAPSQFVSSSPYLVVAQLDWIQTRYLFVKCNTDDFSIEEATPKAIYEQDPKWHPKGPDGRNVILPQNTVSKSRRPERKSSSFRETKRMKIESAIELSDDTDSEDLGIFLTDGEFELIEDKATSNSKAPKKAVVDRSRTDFVPGSLDTESLTLLEPPAYATSSATKALTRELQTTLKVQDSNPLHELGWYIDRDNVNNVYQWIIELHSFDKDLPLANDMKKQNVKSIVMEVRFGAQYPMSPPFVRIISPRFLGFNQGGGGHVTLGGALCMELLTNSGWSAVSNIESVLLQVRLAMMSTDPRPARLDKHARGDYGVGEAVEAYIRACQTHGWEVPPDFRANYASSTSMTARGF